jgi:predicted aspartyl protease
VPDFPLDPSRSIIPVKVELVGKVGSLFVDMALDTGATYTMAAPTFLAAIGCDLRAPAHKIEISTASGLILAPLVRVKALRCLGQEVKDMPILAHSLPGKSPVEGLLGLDFLKRFDVRLAFRKRRLEIS